MEEPGSSHDTWKTAACWTISAALRFVERHWHSKSKERTGVEPSYNIPSPTLHNVFPSARLHLSKVPFPSQTSAIVRGSNVHAHEPMGDVLHLNHSANQLWTKLTSSLHCFFVTVMGKGNNARQSLCLPWLELQLEISQGGWPTSHYEETLNQFLKAKQVFECLESNIRFAP